MNTTLKMYQVEFEGVYPVPHFLLIAAENEAEAAYYAKNTITHTDKFEVKEIDMTKKGVLFYESGDY